MCEEVQSKIIKSNPLRLSKEYKNRSYFIEKIKSGIAGSK